MKGVHWVNPRLVAQVGFSEWTPDGKLRHPRYLGLRDDKKAEDVVKEPKVRLHAASTGRLKPGPVRQEPGDTGRRPKDISTDAPALTVIERLSELEQSRRDGVIELPGGQHLKVTNLHKVFWPRQKLTKGDLFRYYARVAPFILPAGADRPLVM